ncbi:MAG: hypothetical protein U5K28_10260 [Halobacteriales archaeon]|nr:hypothetical protein [Halobacteriales archaeon]
MPSKVASPIDILQEEGPVPLAKKTSLLLARQTSIGRRMLYEKSKGQIQQRIEAEEGLEADLLEDDLSTIVGPGIPHHMKFIQMPIEDEIRDLSNLVRERTTSEHLRDWHRQKGVVSYVRSRYLNSSDKMQKLGFTRGTHLEGDMMNVETKMFREFDSSKEMDFIPEKIPIIRIHMGKSPILVDERVDFLFVDWGSYV